MTPKNNQPMNRINKTLLCKLLPFLVAGALLFLVSNKALAQENFGAPAVYPNIGSQVLGQITIEGEAAESGDVVALYVGAELRGKKEVVVYNGTAWFVMSVSTAGGEETATFKLYDKSAGVTYDIIDLSVVIGPGVDVGSTTEPFMINFVKVPVITLTGGASVAVEVGGSYTDAGATSDGGETVTVSGTVNVNIAGTYTLTYSASDAAGKTGTATRTVTVSDTIAPVITLTGSASVTHELGTTYTDLGATSDGGETVTTSGSVILVCCEVLASNRVF
jgi:hypothetical protein